MASAQDVNNATTDFFPPLPGSSASAASSDLCGTCNTPTRMDAIGCDRCETWFHPSSMCLGLPDEVVNNIVEYDGQGIAFICTECRSNSGKSGGSVPNSAFKQLFQTVKKLCETVQTLSMQSNSTNRVQGEQTTHTRNPGTSQASPNASDVDHLRVLIREEAREIEERNKRKTSIIIRGVEVQSTDRVNATLDPVFRHLLGAPVNLTAN